MHWGVKIGGKSKSENEAGDFRRRWNLRNLGKDSPHEVTLVCTFFFAFHCSVGAETGQNPSELTSTTLKASTASGLPSSVTPSASTLSRLLRQSTRQDGDNGRQDQGHRGRDG